jgi:glycerol-3-phosphate acyltransferase PlsY
MPVNEGLLHNAFYGNLYVREAAALIFAFGMGSIPFGAIVAWLFADIGGWPRRAALAVVPLVDALKTAIPTVIAAHGGGAAVGAGTAAAALAGSWYSPWRRWRAGSGIGALAGVLLALSPLALASVAAVGVVTGLAARDARAGSLVGAAFAVVALWFFVGPITSLGAAAGLVLLMPHWRTAGELSCWRSS